MRSAAVLFLGAVLLSVPMHASAKVLLSDADLDTISAGADVCGLFGISGPCVISYNDVIEPTGSSSSSTVICTPACTIITSTPTPPTKSCFVNSTAVPCNPPPAGATVTCGPGVLATPSCQTPNATATALPASGTVKIKHKVTSAGTSISQRNRIKP
jgi:hypothetical protein